MSESSVNKILVSGRMRDAVLRKTQSGKSVCNFSLAMFSGKSDKPSQWLRCTSWGSQGERVSKLPTDARVRVEGRLETAHWKDNDGNWQHRLQVQCSEVEEIPHLQQPPSAEAIAARPVSDEDIPF
jgi:single stranded DNA-binding protein